MTHWPRTEPPGEREVNTVLRREGLRGHCWSNGPSERYRSHSHPQAKVIYCLAGGIVFHVAGNCVRLSPGDRLDLEPGIVHSADVGPHGVVCLEATRDFEQAGP
ncbi:MAG: cupin domain-containing protein [Actinomycetota bacterium]